MRTWWKMREAWARDLGSAVLGSPVILRDLAIIPTVEGGVYALRLKNGETAWHRTADEGQIIGRVVADGGMIYYGAGRTVIACDAGTGKPRWQTPVGGTVIAGLTAGEGRLFVPAGEHKLYCLDARNGKILWEYTVPRSIMMEPATDGNRVFFGAMDGCVRALDAATGKEVWMNRLSALEDNYTTAPFWPPVIAGDKVIVRKFPANQEEMNLVALSASTGKPIWSHHNASGPLRMVVCPDTDRFYMSYSENRRRGLQCLSANDGKLLWSSLTGVGMSNGIASRDAVLTRDNYNICRVDAGTGNVQWTYKTSTGPQGSYYGSGATAVKDNMAVAGTMDGWVIALTWQAE